MKTMLPISNNVALHESEVEISAIRAQGAGGQNVNKLSTAIHLRFDVKKSSLPDFYKQRLLNLKDHRITKDGIIIIKSQQYRSQEKNREAALSRLLELIKSVTASKKKRIPTKLPKSVQKKRLEQKTRRGKIKTLRKKLISE